MSIDLINNEPTSPTTKIGLDEWERRNEATLQRTVSRLRFSTWPYVILAIFFPMINPFASFDTGDITAGPRFFLYEIMAIGLAWLARHGAKELSTGKLLLYFLHLLIVWLIILVAIVLASFTQPSIEVAVIVFLVVSLIINSIPLYLSASLCVQIRSRAQRRIIYSALIEEMTVPVSLVNNKSTSPTTKTELDEWERRNEAILQCTLSDLRLWTWPCVILLGFIVPIVSVKHLYNRNIPNGLIRFFYGIMAIGLTWLVRRGAKELSIRKLLLYLIYLLLWWLIALINIYWASTRPPAEMSHIVINLVVLIIVFIVISSPLYLSASLCIQIGLRAQRRIIYSALVKKRMD